MKNLQSSNPKLFFLHIPKTGGTTLNSILDNNYALEEFFQGYNMVNKFQSKDDFILQYKNLSIKKRDKIKIFRSHFYFGFHHDLNIPNFQYITILREPLERFISDFYYINLNVNHKLHSDLKKMTFTEYVKTPDICFSDNLQTRLLAGKTSPPCSIKDLHKAQENISKHFALVGIMEKYTETLILLKHLGILESIEYVKQNPTVTRIDPKELSPDILKILKKRNFYDLKLYSYALKLFKNQLAELDGTFHLEIKKMKNQNQLITDQYFYRGYNLYLQGRLEESKRDLKKYLEQTNHYKGFSEMRGRSLFYLGEIASKQNLKGKTFYQKSLEIMSKSIHLGVNNAYMKGTLFKRLKMYNQAQRIFSRITKLFIQGTIIGKAYFHLGEIHLEQGNKKSALEMFKRALKYDPLHGKVNQYLKELEK